MPPDQFYFDGFEESFYRSVKTPIFVNGIYQCFWPTKLRKDFDLLLQDNRHILHSLFFVHQQTQHKISGHFHRIGLVDHHRYTCCDHRLHAPMPATVHDRIVRLNEVIQASSDRPIRLPSVVQPLSKQPFESLRIDLKFYERPTIPYGPMLIAYESALAHECISGHRA